MTNSTPTSRTDSEGTRSWYLNDKLHRIDGPAVEYADGGAMWYANGELHRADGPAFEGAAGGKAWWINGKLHRDNGPAVEHANGTREWYVKGKSHRIDGPAVERANGAKEWYLNGKQIYPPYSHVLTAVFVRGLVIPPNVLPAMLKAMSQKKGAQNDQLNTILHKYWPTDVKKILVTLFMDPDPAIKHLAFSLLGQERWARTTSRRTSRSVRL